MSQPIRWSVSVDKETDAIAEILQRAFAEYVGSNRSRLVCFLFKRFHRNMTGNVAAELEREQGINCAISSEEIPTFNNESQIEFPAQAFPVDGRAKPLTRIVAPPSKGARQREVRGVNRRQAVDGVDLWAYRPLPFPAGVRRTFAYKSNSFRRVA